MSNEEKILEIIKVAIICATIVIIFIGMIGCEEKREILDNKIDQTQTPMERCVAECVQHNDYCINFCKEVITQQC